MARHHFFLLFLLSTPIPISYFAIFNRKFQVCTFHLAYFDVLHQPSRVIDFLWQIKQTIFLFVFSIQLGINSRCD